MNSRRLLPFACRSTGAFRHAGAREQIAAAFRNSPGKPPTPATLVKTRDAFLGALPRSLRATIQRLSFGGGREYLAAIDAGVRWLARKHVKARAAALAASSN